MSQRTSQDAVDLKNALSHLGTQSCLIYEPSMALAVSLRTGLQALGVPQGQIWIATKLSQATTFMTEKHPTIFIGELALQDPEEQRLLEMFESFHDESKRMMIITGSSIELPFIAEAAEGQIDSYALKPFSPDAFRQIFLRTFVQKLSPSEYFDKISEARVLRKSGRLEDALRSLDEAKSLSPKSARAHFLSGEVQERLGFTDRAIEQYREARAKQPSHYGSIVAEFEIHYREMNFEEATKLVPLIRSLFPVSAFRLAQLIETVAHSKTYSELEPLFECYRKLEKKSDNLVEIAETAFFMAGRSALAKNENDSGIERAMKFFEMGSQVSLRRFHYIEKVTNLLILAKAFKEAEHFLTKTEAEETNTPSYHRMSFMVAQHTANAVELMNRGRQLVFAGLANADIYRIVVKLFAQADKQTMAESIIARAVYTNPELRTSLFEVLESNLPSPNDTSGDSADPTANDSAVKKAA